MFGITAIGNLLNLWRKGFLDVVFPRVCVCCGEEVTLDEHQICSFCLNDRFEDANPENTVCAANSVLPEGVMVQHALWNYYKGGDLQHIIHQLKYERMVQVGVDLGIKLGRRVRYHPVLKDKLSQKAVILPVPLHEVKYRKRGFNQAYEIARGFQKEWPSIPICSRESVVRTKVTSTQTGFSIQQRLDNMKGAFKVKYPTEFTAKVVIIIDDVFTTGATTYELAQALKSIGLDGIIILTVAQA